MNEQAIIDDGDLRKYRTELPNMADDDLDPFQYRLYAHYKRVCGANGGECYEGVRTTADKTKMSAEKVISTRQWLVDNGWIDIDQRAKGTFSITIIDRWLENFVRYSEQSKRKTVRYSEQSTRKPLEIPNSTVRNSEQTPLEISNQRNNQYKNEPIEEECACAQAEAPQPATPSPLPLSASSSTSTGDRNMDAAKAKFERGGRVASSWQAELNLELAANVRVPLAKELARVSGWEALINAGDDGKNRECHEAAIYLYKMGIGTPADLKDWYAVYLSDPWHREKNANPKPEKVKELISKKAQAKQPGMVQPKSNNGAKPAGVYVGVAENLK